MKRAFTLVEALIVVAVVVLLAAFLWPVLERSRGRQRQSVCDANLKQIALGFMQYTRDYDETWPPARITALAGWANAILPYTKSPQLFKCPAAVSVTTSLTSDYFYNRHLARRSYTFAPSPGRVILLGDGQGSASAWNSWTELPGDAGTNRNSPSQRHLEGANYGFMDGHVKWIKPGDLSRQARWTMP